MILIIEKMLKNQRPEGRYNIGSSESAQTKNSVWVAGDEITLL